MRSSTIPALLSTALFVFASVATAETRNNDARPELTFHRDVEPILQHNCQSCHRPGGDNYTGMVAPMSLVSYSEVRPWARSIAREVESKAMPPWFAAPEFHGVFSNERTLTEAEIATIVDWARAGAPAGDPADAPVPLEFDDGHGWRIGQPDLVVTAPSYFVPDEADTHYVTHQVTLTEDMLPESRWIQAIEWKGGSEVVHHIVGYAVVPGEGGAAQRYGLGSIAPGEEPMHFPDGYAKLLVKGSTLLFNMHYHKEKGEGTGAWDASQVAFRFHPEGADISHFVDHDAIGNVSFEIPPGNGNWRVGSARVFETDTTLLAIHPHMHLRGKAARYVAYYPDGTEETILDVPQFDFDWQTDYSFAVPKRLPAGTRLEYIAWFDNSAENPANPDPNKAQGWGRETWDEMMLGYVTFADSEARELKIDEVVAASFSGRAPDPHDE